MAGYYISTRNYRHAQDMPFEVSFDDSSLRTEEKMYAQIILHQVRRTRTDATQPSEFIVVLGQEQCGVPAR